MPRKPLIAGNWKMNGLRDEGLALAVAVAEGAEARRDSCDMLICPPATLLHPIADAVTEKLGDCALLLGAQDCHPKESGAHTGDLSVGMLADAGCDYVIVGHSERRADHGEDDATVKAKAEAAHAAGLTAIICVGETEDQRDQGMALATISSQLDLSVPEGATPENTVIAYEPVWAIGTGRTASPEDAQEVHRHIRLYLKSSHGRDIPDGIRILYGGSMKPGNAADLIAQPDIDGGLIGGASLKAEDFLKIADAV